MAMSRVLSRILLIGGVLLLAEGSFSVYPFLFPAAGEVDIDVSSRKPTTDALFEPGSYLFQLSFPRQKKTFDVVEGTTRKALRKGPGHLEGTAMPGSTGNSVIAGHRDTHFRVLKDVALGDEIRIDVGEKRYVYRIVSTHIVPPTDVSSLNSSDDPILTLVTCYPFYFVGPAPDRFIVRAKAVEPQQLD
jgi:LPXTG-site transpeptidase (sortase) family protein